MSHPLAGFTAPDPMLVLADDGAPAPPPDIDSIVVPMAELAGLEGPSVKQGQRSVLLVTADRASLRRLAPQVPRLGQVRVVACWLYAAEAPLVVVPPTSWPRVTSLMARETGQGVLTVLRFEKPLPAHRVLAAICHQAAPRSGWGRGVVVGVAGGAPPPGLDLGTVLTSSVADAVAPERDVPPDVVLTEAADQPVPPHHVIDRAPVLVAHPGVEPVDEAVVNPVGWRKDWDLPVADVDDLTLPGGVTEAALPALRRHQGVRVRLGETPTRLVAALAVAGVPLLVSGSDEALHPALAKALAPAPDHPDLDDPLAREEHSVAVRRAALDTHSTLAWRGRLAERAGTRYAGLPTVSVLLATKRPHQLDFALRQVARQVDVDAELVLATHGFAADPGQVREALGDRAVTLLDHPAEAFFGDVLHSAAQAARGDALAKFDDDDWYGPHVLHDLLLAQHYAGADVVGMPSEFVYLEELGVTTRRNHPTEIQARFVAGGTLLVPRHVLRAVGGFRRVRRYVDTQLLTAVDAAGGRIYRTQGLGYVLRRTGSGHTWEKEAESFRREDIVAQEWPGFHASRALALAEADLP